MYNSMDRSKKDLNEENYNRPRGTVLIESTQIKWFWEQSGREAGPREQWPKPLKTKLSSRGALEYT
jgi:hypothetical protein